MAPAAGDELDRQVRDLLRLPVRGANSGPARMTHPRRTGRAGFLEVVLVAGLYLAGELSRGLARGGTAIAEAHAATIVRLERSLHLSDERAVQRAVDGVHGLPALLGYAYLTLHLTGTAAVLAWVYRRHRDAYARLRNMLAVATALGVIG